MANQDIRFIQKMQDALRKAAAEKARARVLLEENELLKEQLSALRKTIAAAKNLLAVLHRDGGHHTERVGFVQSCDDAARAFPWMLAVIEAAERLDLCVLDGGEIDRRAELSESHGAFIAAMAEVRKGEG